VLCAAAVVLLCIVLKGLLDKHHMWHERRAWQTGGLAPVRRPVARLLQWLLVYYSVPVSVCGLLCDLFPPLLFVRKL